VTQQVAMLIAHLADHFSCRRRNRDALDGHRMLPIL
jgi:hypothetical protein